MNERTARIATVDTELVCILGEIIEITPLNDNFVTVKIDTEWEIETHLVYTPQIPEEELQQILHKKCFFQMFLRYTQWVVFDYIFV